MASPPAHPVQTLGHYALRKKLGVGAMGQVWLAHDKLLDRDVAVKVLLSGASNKRMVQDFLREAQAAAKLNHPNTVTIHQIGKQGDKVYIAMEYVEAGSLSDELRDKGAFPWKQATQAIRDAAAGLQAAHERGMVHRDVKPSNLMRSARGLVKVVDFGLAKARTSDSQATQTVAGTILGSPAYMSPEQCRGERADARSDLYSLICSYYQLLTRETPFAASELTAAMYQHCHAPFPDVRATGVKVPDGVCRILEKGSRKKPEERYQSAAELIADLDAVLHAPEASHIYSAEAGLSHRENVSDRGPAFVGSILKGKGIMGKTTWAVVALTVAWLSIVAMRRHAPSPENPAPGDEDSPTVLAASAAGLAPVPSQSAQYNAEQTLRSVLKDDYSKHDAADRQALAVKLLVQGQGDTDPVMRFVLFREARDLAALAGNTTVAFQAVDEAAKGYAVDAVNLKATAFVTASLHATAPEDVLALSEGGFELLNQAAATDHYAEAGRIGPLVESAAAKTKDIALLSKVQIRNREIADIRHEFDKQKAAFDALRLNPADPEANLAVGRYMCFLKNNWDTGLPMLAKGSNAILKDLAAKELANPADPTTQLYLADGWWDQIPKQSSAGQLNLEGHAGAWYQKALPNLSNADRARAEPRLPKNVAPTAAPTVVTAPASPGKPPASTAVNDAMAAKAEVHLVRSYVGAATENSATFTGHVYLTPDGRSVVQIGPGHNVAAWERASGRQVLRGSGFGALSPDERFIVWSDNERSSIVDLANPDRGMTLGTTFTDRERAAMSPDHTRLAVSNKDLAIWDLRMAKKIQHTDREHDAVRYSPDGLQLLCWSSYAGAVHGASLFDARTLTLLWHNPEVNYLHFASFSRDGTRIVTGDYSFANVLDATTGKILATCGIQNRFTEIEPLFSPDGHFVLVFWHGKPTEAKHGPVEIYQTETGTEIGRLRAPIPPAFSADWSPDGKRILVGCDDGAMRLLDFETGKILQVFGGHTGGVRAVTFSFDGKFVASCCDDNKVRLFQIVVP